ncbi:hypothetical protein DZA28_03455 [Pseudomonas alloputida]|uniref:Uncharacterized protein n=1 Tax=Pseudomonas alloputida TaxID=1940621 RepID=A0ABY3D094_9PSED|nr:hypothetical protein F7661_01970 [Pseudomonas sp. CFA]TRZ59053.1 hypothetical protein DZA28_03455 [Pseudomonas alloputida]
MRQPEKGAQCNDKYAGCVGAGLPANKGKALALRNGCLGRYFAGKPEPTKWPCSAATPPTSPGNKACSGFPAQPVPDR